MNQSITSKLNTVMTGDCVELLRSLPTESVDLVLTDPPYLVTYRPRDGRRIENDTGVRWLRPAFAELFRVLKSNSFCLTFYGWPSADLFVSAFRTSGFRLVSHISFVKSYASFVGYTRAQHEVAYLLAKGRPPKPEEPISDVLHWQYTENKLHPAQKPVSVLVPLVEAFSKPDGIVLDPFCGSGSSLVAAIKTSRQFLGIEIDPMYAQLSRSRLAALGNRKSAA